MARCLLLTLLLVYIVSGGEAQVQCPQETGHPSVDTRFTNGLNVGSVAKFLCPAAMYAWPVSSRTCEASGGWSIMRSKSGRKSTKIYCNEMRCPNPDRFENGEYFPRGPYKVGDNVTFVCNDGYIPRGSMERSCKSNAKWSGETAVCDDGAGHCPDPGVPPGAMKTGFRYDVNEKVSYTCANGLDLVGSAKRTCLESRRWSGTEVSCQYPYAFDLPEDAGQQFAGSLSGLLNTYKKKAAVGRTVKIKKDGILNVYLLLDASDSVGEENFDISKKSVVELVERLGSFDMIVQFGIMSYATETKVTINVHDKEASDPEYVVEEIEKKLIYEEHRKKQGTNIKGALAKVYEMMSLQKDRYPEDKWNSIQHVIILLTDGKSNMGGRPVDMINRIRDFLDIKSNREDYLDIYAFGIGEAVDRSELNDIASKKDNEKHIFTLENTERIKTVFQEITKIEEYGDMCGLNDPSDKTLHHPWNVLIGAGSKNPCFGSLISSQWVLTAAHCFKDHTIDQYTFKIGSTYYKGEQIIIHECYNLNRKAQRGIKEDYDYDVALVKLTKEVEYSNNARLICLPCTEMANRAMKKPKTATCNDHRQYLLSSVSGIPAGFLARSPQDKNELEELEVQIQHNNEREECVSTIKRWDKFHNITNLKDMVSPRHLCVNGQMSCKGESGGALFVDIRNRKRFFQVGILSFGIYNPCEKKTVHRTSPNARDFYVNVMEVLPFLRKHLQGELQFLPGIPDPEEIVCPA